MDYTFWIPVIISIGALFWNFWQQKSIEKLKRENEKANLIHKVQFEKEFEIYNDLWGKLIDLRNHTGALRPQMDSYDPNQSEEERMKERLEKLNDSFNACLASFDKNKPFYPQDVYDKIEKALRLSRSEAIDYQHGDKHSREYWEDSKKNIDEMIDAMEKVCEIMRKRIGLIRIKE